MSDIRPFLTIIAPLSLAVPGIAFAQSSVKPIATSDMSKSIQAGSSSPMPFDTPAIDDHALERIAGREDTTQISRADQVAGVSHNSVGDNAVTGDARISDNAFQNMSGLSILNVNTGNNVAINASLNVNISLTPAP